MDVLFSYRDIGNERREDVAEFNIRCRCANVL